MNNLVIIENAVIVYPESQVQVMDRYLVVLALSLQFIATVATLLGILL
jgi:hypothetical protein